ncbi:MAG: formate dehydrogenase [Candidatus Abyssobacteria bacterium SURF_17]|uniref:Formate dehydrogenase n=1 Tax=Candidatus Abyssobacteria bacterium SURF_17 TaxID=2093361 RepID=A0A419F096_9BACT|nr:MAG: formate dehydrogenase [Candidatus Abyssubacteria bacterium SURF_17]
MTAYSKLSVTEGSLNESLAALFKSMLEKNVVDAVLVPAHQRPKGVMQTLITEPGGLVQIDPFAPVVPVSTATLVSKLTNVPSGRPLAVVMRSCEVRALLELVKLKQASVEDLVLIGIDCLGRYENADYMKLEQNGSTSKAFLEAARDGMGAKSADEPHVATACKICEYPVSDNVDIRLCVIGCEPNEVFIEWVSDKGEEARKALGIDVQEAPSGRKEAVEKIKKTRIAERDKVFADIHERVNSLEKLRDYLAGCVNCYNCRVACPVCYCKECVFVTDTFRHPGDRYVSWADKRGSLKMPTESLLYHLTRMTHMSTLCVGCGQCTSACPNNIELSQLFRAVAQKTQARFDYHPGRSLDEPQPLAVFYAEELVEVTGQVK